MDLFAIIATVLANGSQHVDVYGPYATHDACQAVVAEHTPHTDSVFAPRAGCVDRAAVAIMLERCVGPAVLGNERRYVCIL